MCKAKLRRYKSSLRSFVEKRLTLASRRRVILERGGFRLPLLSAVLPALASLLFRQAAKKVMTLRNMYLVPVADYDAGRHHLHPPPPPQPVKTKSVPKRTGRTASQHPHDKWVALRTKLLEADITEAELIHRFSNFLRKVLPRQAPHKAAQRLPSAEQRPKIETVELAETPRQTLVNSGRRRRPAVLVMRCRSRGLAAVAMLPERPIPTTISEGSMRSRVPI